jgi:hypothetical protein
MKNILLTFFYNCILPRRVVALVLIRVQKLFLSVAEKFSEISFLAHVKIL